MGRFKPLLPFGPATVIESCLQPFFEADIDPIVLVLGHRAEEIRSRLQHPRLQFTVNPDPQSQMADSIRLGVKAVPENHNGVLICPADFPAVPFAVLRSLITSWESNGAKIFIPTYQGRGGHPILIDLSLRQELQNLKQANGLRGLCDRYRYEVCRVPVESAFIARDVDTWEDYVTLHRDVFGTTPAVGPTEAVNGDK